jgi:anti-anti-sigma factor
MSIAVEITNQTAFFKISGPITSDSSQDLTDEFTRIANNKAIYNVIFDLTEVPTISSAGIGKLLKFYKHLEKKGGTLEIKGISAALKRQFTDIHLNMIVKISDK